MFFEVLTLWIATAGFTVLLLSFLDKSDRGETLYYVVSHIAVVAAILFFLQDIHAEADVSYAITVLIGVGIYVAFCLISSLIYKVEDYVPDLGVRLLATGMTFTMVTAPFLTHMAS